MADFLGMMKQAAQLQSKMQAMQDELGNVEVEGISGGGLALVHDDQARQLAVVLGLLDGLDRLDRPA